MMSTIRVESLYDVLELENDASQAEVTMAYSRLIGQMEQEELVLYSLDDSDADDWEVKREKIQLAYETLSDAKRRLAYDRQLGADSKPAQMRRRTVAPIGERAQAAADAVARSYELRKINNGDPTRLPPRPEKLTIVAPVEEAKPVFDKKADEAGGHKKPKPKGSQLADEEQATIANARVSSVERLARRFNSVKQLGKISNVIQPQLEVLSRVREREGYDGEALRCLRESSGASLDEILEITKINKRYLVAIEENDFAILPAPVYVRGFICQYAQVLGLPSDEVADSYMNFFKSGLGKE